MLMMSGPEPLLSEASILVLKSVFGICSYEISTFGCFASYSLMSALFNAIIGGCVCVQNVRWIFPPLPPPLLLHAALVAATNVAETTAPIQRLCFMGSPWSVRGMGWLIRRSRWP